MPAQAMAEPTLGRAAMIGVRARHLERRCGIYGLRVRVPDDIRPLVGMVEKRRSLRTSDLYRARAQSSLQAARLFEIFEMVRSNQDQFNRDEARAIIAASLYEVANMMAAPPTPGSRTPLQRPLDVFPHDGPKLNEAVEFLLATQGAELDTEDTCRPPAAAELFSPASWK